MRRRAVAGRAAWLAAWLAMGATGGAAEPRRVSIGIDFSLTGADAAGALRMRDGALLAIEQANAAHGVPGVVLVPMVLDDASATTGQYDPAQAATNARRMVAEADLMAAVGPQMSGAARAMAPILNEADLAMVSPAATSAELTSVRRAEQYRASGRVTFFRVLASDALQGPAMAEYFAGTLHAKSVFVLDDGGAYGVGLADAFAQAAAKHGMLVLGRDRLDPKASDYAAAITRIAGLKPAALYYGGVFGAGIKVVKQAHDLLPGAVKGAGDGMYGPEMLTAAGFPAAEGWYVSVGAAHPQGDAAMAAFTAAYRKRWDNLAPDDYAAMAHDAANVVIDAIRRVAAKGAVSRAAVRAAIAGGTVDTLQGPIGFDANGDKLSRVISLYQLRQDPKAAPDDMDAQFRFLGNVQAK